MKINRPKLNLIVDTLAFVCAVFLIATGFILKYVLPPGSGRLETEGLGPGSLHRTILLLWGFTRHEWGDIHLWLALALLGALSLHLLLHWQWIVCMVQGRPRQGSGLRVAVGILGLVSLLALALAPFFTSPERLSRQQVLEQRQVSAPLK
ncbi:MAG TPA: DUF4405 domain-containing protein [Terriglobia bacterium]|nr:DUF4405 domain-containing protein [Terriglobia bacterium]